MDKKLAQLSCTFSNPDATSTAELVLRLFQASDITPSPNVATSLLTGIIFDTKRFLISDPSDFSFIMQLINADGDYRLALNLLQSKMDRPERLARLKTAQRLKIIEIKEWVLAISHVSAYGASASRSLLHLGADISLVYTEEKGTARISSRSSTEFYKKTGVNLSEDIMIPISEMFHGNGGGHPTAAGANGIRNVKKAITKIVKILEEKISS
jgi:nanoRNase/pAp phosphatase (c-di-AMP/oligoRNAs hydrolase)